MPCAFKVQILYLAAVKSILDFGFRPNERLNLEITSRCGPLFFALHLLNKIQIANCNSFRPPCISRRQLTSESDLYELSLVRANTPREAIHVVDRCDARHHPAEQRLAEGFAYYRGGLEHLLLALRQPIDARRQDGLNASRHLQHFASR